MIPTGLQIRSGSELVGVSKADLAAATGRSVYLTAAQVRRACALLRWGSPTLAERSGVVYEVLCLGVVRDRTSDLPAHDLPANLMTPERAGVHLESDAEGRPGAALATTA